MVHASTVSIAIPSTDAGVMEQLTVPKGISFVEKAIGIQGVGGQGFFSKTNVVKSITGSNLLGNQFADATKSAGPGGVTQLMGALALSYVESNTEAVIDTDGTVSSRGRVLLRSHGETVSYLRADGSLYKTPTVVPGVTMEDPPKTRSARLSALR